MFLTGVVFLVIGIFIGTNPYHVENFNSVSQIAREISRPLDIYTIENLSKAPSQGGSFRIENDLESDADTFESFVFSFEFSPTLRKNDATKKTTGLLNVPVEDGKYPLVILFRGYVDQTIYQTGIGSKPASDFFAEEGFISVSPDFLGYAGSSEEAGNIFETRFQTYTTAISLVQAIDQPSFAEMVNDKWDGENVFIWAHSNGGQVALTLLTVMGLEYPTTLWAPVTKPFPYSILYYTDESEDEGKFIRRELARFEELYDVDLYSFDKYLEKINAPLHIHQGTLDDAIPLTWTNSFVISLKNLEKEVRYFTHGGADHNMRPAWGNAIEADLSFFRDNLK